MLSYSVLTADTLRYAVTLTSDSWPWNLKCMYCAVVKLCTKFKRNRAMTGGVIFDLMPLNICRVLRYAEIICTELNSSQPICSWFAAFVMLIRCYAVRCDLHLSYVDLKRLLHIRCHVSKSVPNSSKIEQSEAEFANLADFCPNMSRCDPDLWPLDLERLQQTGCHVIKLCTQSEWKWTILGWFMDDLAHFRCPIFSGDSHPRTVLRVH